MPPVSLLATLVGTLLGFVLGAIWYGPMFGKAWMEEHGFTEESLKQNFSPGRTYGATFVLGFLAAYVFGVVIGPDPAMSAALGAGALIGVAWIFTSIATNYLFEVRSLRLLLINGGYHVIRFVLIGLAFGMLG